MEDDDSIDLGVEPDTGISNVADAVEVEVYEVTLERPSRDSETVECIGVDIKGNILIIWGCHGIRPVPSLGNKQLQADRYPKKFVNVETVIEADVEFVERRSVHPDDSTEVNI